MDRSLGWDESMHAALPAARMVLALKAGQTREAIDVALDCQQYPPVYPAFLATVQSIAGVGEGVARAATRGLWALGLFGLFLLGRAIVDRIERDAVQPFAGAALVPWILPAIALTSPMALAFSGTLFLEIPFTVAATFALWAWMRRGGATGRAERVRRDLLAGALIAVCFFTKFNYALLLGLGLALDLAIESAGLIRAGRARQAMERVIALGLPSALAWLWWFVLPFPAGAEVAASHRSAFLAFLGGNTQLGTTPYAIRVWDMATYLAPGPRGLLITLGAAGLALVWVRRPAVRCLALVLVTGFGPILAHNFHLERFLLPPALALWALAAVGLARLAPTSRAGRAIFLGAVGAVGLVSPTLDAGLAAGALGLRTADNAEYLAALHRQRLSLSPARGLPTAGLQRAEYDALLDAAAAAAGPTARVAWLGINSELSPAALHLGLLARGGAPERLRRDAGRVRPDGQPEMVVTFMGEDPGWNGAQLRAWAGQFDVVFSTEPLDWKGRAHRAFLETYRGWLFETGEWSYASIARLAIARAGGRATDLELYACRHDGE
ncbi:hypothetical protein Pla86_39650 [Planctomycetes bacterium Pla86]|uniref:Glycosyltransferase RgtA/B/C/D-like domain-containing protein n=2 Tax=Engelhardtia mirabilis TaxID=2528011 RepID=A0A518BPH4_9BACT|nr:hypothetical protein Pla133_39660 [Planctomycetes bacterium Pla133]QDV03183.1 hypothetical protein Pla86_39650 [Planctomycetes bacterium Pla86]